MNYDHIDYKKEEKYPHFNIEIENHDNYNITAPNTTNSDIAKLIIKDKSENNINLNYEVSIIPKKSGTKIINIEFELADDNGNIKRKIIKKIEITIDKNLSVKYKIVE